MAEHYGKTPAQICIKWNLQHGFLPLSKSVNEDRMRANLEVEDFEIAEEDMRKLEVLKALLTEMIRIKFCFNGSWKGLKEGAPQNLICDFAGALIP